MVTDNGPAYKSDLFSLFNRFILSVPWMDHIRTRFRPPQTNGVVIERFFARSNTEHLYRHEIPHGLALNDEAEAYRRTGNQVWPHEALDFATPLAVYQAAPPPFSLEYRPVNLDSDQQPPLGS